MAGPLLPATVVPARRRWRAFEWLARHCGWMGPVLAAAVPLSLMMLGGGFDRAHPRQQLLLLSQVFVVIYFAGLRRGGVFYRLFRHLVYAEPLVARSVMAQPVHSK